jgi:hypothetical protein
MRQTVYALFKPDDDIFVNGYYVSPNQILTIDILTKMCKSCRTEWFYVIKSQNTMGHDFTFCPEDYDAQYIHVVNDSILIFNKSAVMNNMSTYVTSGAAPLKFINLNNIINDIVFISNGETNADKNYNILKTKFNRAKRINGVKGIHNAHIEAARIAESDMVYIVDADAIVQDTFNFDYPVSFYNRETVHVWKSINPVNNLVYGYGGIKLFPQALLLNYTGNSIDFTTSVSKEFKIMNEISNITEFNTDEFSAWKSGFRECAKLASKIILNQEDRETEDRLNIWCNVCNDVPYSAETLRGANEGKIYGLLNANMPDKLRHINDFEWLKARSTILTK